MQETSTIPFSGTEGTSVESLGRLLIERKQVKKIWVIAYWLMALGAVGLALLFLFSGLWLAVAIAGLIGLILAWYAFELPYRIIRCYEHGVCKLTRRTQNSLRYDEMAAFTYAAVQYRVNGMNAGIDLKIIFTPRARMIPPLTYVTRMSGTDEELENFKVYVSSVLAAQLSEKLEKDGYVNWTPDVRITQKGLEFRPLKLFGEGEWTKANKSKFERIEFDNGCCRVFLKESEKEVVALDCEPNYFPGFLVFQKRNPELFKS